MSLPICNLDCIISIIEASKLISLFDYHETEKPINYWIVRDPNTRKFPILNITFWAEGGFGKHYYGCIAVPPFPIDIAGAMTYDSQTDSMDLKYEFDMNEYDANPIIKNLDVFVVKIYTQSNSFRGYCNRLNGKNFIE